MSNILKKKCIWGEQRETGEPVANISKQYSELREQKVLTRKYLCKTVFMGNDLLSHIIQCFLQANNLAYVTNQL